MEKTIIPTKISDSNLISEAVISGTEVFISFIKYVAFATIEIDKAKEITAINKETINSTPKPILIKLRINQL